MLEPLEWPRHRRYAVREARRGDHRLFPARPDFKAEHEAAGAPLEQEDLPPGLGWALLFDGFPIGLAFATEHDGGVWRVSAFLSDFSRRDWAFAAQATRAGLRWIEQVLGASEICVSVRKDMPEARRFAERMGFAHWSEGATSTGWYLTMIREG